jgi:hypothetical protein
MSESTTPFDDLSADDIAKIARKMNKASDSYAKLNAIGEFVDWGERLPLLWHMTRTGAYETWNDPLLWGELEGGLDSASAEDVAEFLTKVESYDAGDYNITRLVEWWPLSLDKLVARAYAEDAEAFESRLDELSEPVRRGIDLVRRRFGAIERDEVQGDVVRGLAYEQVNSYGITERVYMPGDDGAEEVRLRDHEGRYEAFDEFIELFGTTEEWGEAVLAEALEVDSRLDVARTIEAWQIADRDQLAKMLAAVNTGNRDVERLYQLFVEERDDAPGDLFWLADHLIEESRDWVSEVCAACAVLRLDAAGEPVPEDAVEYFTGRSIFSSSHRDKYGGGLARLVEVMRALPEQAAQDQTIAQFQKDYPDTSLFLVLQAWPEDAALIERALDALVAYAEEREPNFPGMDRPAHGLGFVGEAFIDTYIERLEETDDPIVHDTLQRAVVYTLADLAERDGDFDAKYDKWVRFSGWKHKETDPYYFGHYLSPDLKKIVKHLPEERVEAILSEQLTGDDAQWGRALEGASVRQTEAVLEAAFDALAEADELPTGGRGWNWMERFFRELDDDALSQLGAALSRSEAPDFHNAVQKVLGDERYEEILAEHGASAAADDSRAAKVRRLSEKLFEERPAQTRTKLCFFERGDEPPKEGELNRIGGRPIGIDADSWPHRGGDDDEPMHHMVTLDAETIPTLRAAVGEDVRAVALFVHSPDYNEAWEAYNGQVEVVHLTQADIDKGPYPEDELPAGEDNPRGFSVETVEVPDGIFWMDYDDDDPQLREIRDLVYSAHAYSGGHPLWLQYDESTGSPFLFQFDEGFVWMNLGDMGVMYVFSDTGFWQCH